MSRYNPEVISSEDTRNDLGQQPRAKCWVVPNERKARQQHRKELVARFNALPPEKQAEMAKQFKQWESGSHSQDI